MMLCIKRVNGPKGSSGIFNSQRAGQETIIAGDMGLCNEKEK